MLACASMPVAAAMEMAVVGSVFLLLRQITGDARQAPLYLSLFIGAVAAAALTRYWSSLAVQGAALEWSHQIAVAIQQRILGQPYSAHARQHSSDAIAAIQKVELLASGLLLSTMHAAASAMMALAILGSMTLVSVETTTALLTVITISYVVISMPLGKRLARASHVLDRAYGERIKAQQEALGAIRDILIDGDQDRHVERFAQADRRLNGAQLAFARVAAMPRLLVEAIGLIAIAIYATILMKSGQGLTEHLPQLGALALGGQRILPLLQSAYQCWANSIANRPLVDDVLKLLSLPQEARVQSNEKPFQAWLSFREVSYSYPPAGRQALAGITMDISRGERIALAGPNGSGKSTLADLIMGLTFPTKGEVRIDRILATSRDMIAWRGNVSHVPQRMFLFDRSIAENIALVEPEAIDMTRLSRAIGMVKLEPWLEGLADGVWTRTGEDGSLLSGGQRQRIAIARAIYRDRPVLVLDEATNALDEESVQAIGSAIDELCQEGKTFILIAHGLESRDRFDRIVHLADGRIVRTETPGRLNDRENVALAG